MCAAILIRSPLRSGLRSVTVRRRGRNFADKERRYQPSLSETELQLIVQARGLAEFSKHYPQVYEGDESVDAQRGLQMVENVLSKRIPKDIYPHNGRLADGKEGRVSFFRRRATRFWSRFQAPGIRTRRQGALLHSRDQNRQRLRMLVQSCRGPRPGS